jgi:hypothetical protein
MTTARRSVPAEEIRQAALDEDAGGRPYVLRDAHVAGELQLDGAEIRRALRFESCVFERRPGFEGASTLSLAFRDCVLPGLAAQTVRISGGLDLRGSTLGERDGTDEALNVVHADIAGELLLSGAHLVAPGRVALAAGGLAVRGAVYAEDEFLAEGEVRFPGAELTGGLWMRGARIRVGAPESYALHADNLHSAQVRLQHLWTDGRIRLRGAQIADLVSLQHAEVLGVSSALMCVGMRTEALDLQFARRPAGAVNLANAHATRIQDDPATWPAALTLDGLTYDWLGETTQDRRTDVARRLEWLRRQTPYAPQPYEQLASYYRRLGHDDEARRVLLVRERRRRAVLGPAGRAWGGLLDATVGYGYRPWLAGLWLVLLTLLGSVAFRSHTPVPDKAGEGPPFHPTAYALDLLIPVGGLGQRGNWHWAEPWLQNLSYALIAIGWLLTTAVVAGVTRTLNRG